LTSDILAGFSTFCLTKAFSIHCACAKEIMSHMWSGCFRASLHVVHDPADVVGLRSSSVILWSQLAIVDLDLPMTLNGLALGLLNANLTRLDILM
jgi:hypothetical protein